MKLSFLLLALMIGKIGMGQTYTAMKIRATKQDSVLDRIFERYKKAQDSAADIRNIEMINNFSDSADRYGALAAAFLYEKQLDSCIWAIHIADAYITNTQCLLHLKPMDSYKNNYQIKNQ
jgi:hypothetical protein